MIPKKIHFCWLSGDPYPELIKFCIASWKEKLPDYELVLWDLKRFDINSTQWTKQAFMAKKYAFATDYIRLYALYNEGGIYLDSDVEVIRKIDDLLKNKSFIGFETTGDIEPAIIGAEKNASWIKKCLDYYEGRSFVKNNGTLDTRPLPLIIGEMLEDELRLLKGENLPFTVSDISFYPNDFFSPKNIHTGKINKTKKTVAIHHFDGSWVDKSFKSKLKDFIHLVIFNLLGNSTHKKVVSFFRKIKK